MGCGMDGGSNIGLRGVLMVGFRLRPTHNVSTVPDFFHGDSKSIVLVVNSLAFDFCALKVCWTVSH